MSLFNRVLVTTLPLVPKFIVSRFAARYVAGETLDDAMRAVRALNAEGAMTTVDVLGEEVHERDKASAAVDAYIEVLEALEKGLEGGKTSLNGNVSIKPTMLGLNLDEDFCRDNLRRIVEVAAGHGNFVRIDMEDRTTTDATLRIYRQLRADGFDNVGVVLQAYMRRTLDDIAALPEDANVRLCKGIYIEPREVAWKGYETVRLNFVETLKKLFRRGIYVGIATHDEYLACAACAVIDELGLPKDRYEFQMLYGVDVQLRRILIAGGHRLRVYVPYGVDWYPYSMRRLRENPEIAGHVVRAVLHGRRA